MRRVVFTLGAALALGACEKPHTAAEGAATVIGLPVGPSPGVGDVEGRKNPYFGDRNAAMEGRHLFVMMNCYGCHGGHAGGGMGPSLRDPDWRFGKTSEKIFASIAQGRGHGMPAWGLKLPERQIWELTTYIETLGTPSEPEPPQ